MRKKNDKKKFARPKARLGLPDLDQSDTLCLLLCGALVQAVTASLNACGAV